MTSDGAVAPRERVHFTYRPHTASDPEFREPPLKILVLADFTQRSDAPGLSERRRFSVDKGTLNQRIAERAPALEITVPDRRAKAEGAEATLSLRFASLKDFTPEGVAKQIPELREMLDLRTTLHPVRALLGSVPSFNKRIKALLADEAGRARIARDIERTRSPDADKGAEGSLLAELLAEAHVTPREEGYDTVHRGLSAFLERMLATGFAEPRSYFQIARERIVELDATVSARVNAVMHHPAFQRLEAAWRSLEHLISRVDFREGITVDALDCSKDDLAIDFEDAPDTTRSGLYELLHTGSGIEREPYGLIVADYEFGPSSRDVWLLSRCAAVAEVSHAPFIAAAAPSMVSAPSWSAMPFGAALGDALDRADHSAWRAFRARGESRFVGLCAPRFLLRMPYGYDTVPVKRFDFEEDVGARDERQLWGNAAFVLATVIAGAFARYRWCVNIVGAIDGALRDLPFTQTQRDGEVVTRRPIEVTLGADDASRLADAGIIAITDEDRAPVVEGYTTRSPEGIGFAFAPSCHLAEITSEASPEALGRRLLSQLPYLFAVTRVAHCITAVHGPSAVVRATPDEARAQLDAWLQTYVAQIDDPSPAIRCRRPFREASIALDEVRAPTPGYHYKLSVRPHFTFEGAPFTLTLAGRLDP